MADISATIKDFQGTRFLPLKLAWEVNVTDPYTLAYHRAHEKFEKTLKKQAVSDKFKVDLAFAALSLCGGSLMAAVFAEVALKAVAGRVVVDFICRYNMERAFTAASFVATNKTAEFIVGAVWDQAATMLTAETKKLFGQNANNFPTTDALIKKPYEIKAALDGFVKSSILKVNAVCLDILSSPRDASEKEAAFSMLTSSPFCKQPNGKTLPKKLAKRIELTFYLRLVLSTDHLVKRLFLPRSPGSPWVMVGNEPITQTPGHKNYPTTSNAYRKDGGGTVVHAMRTGVEYGQVGQDIIDRMNALIKELYPKWYPMMDSSWLGETTSAEVLKRAADLLQQIGSFNVEAIKQQSKTQKV